MSYRTTQAIVLQRSDWRENDRILTLFCPELGRQDVLCRSCRRPSSPLLAASELFTLGEYVLYQGKGRQILHSATVSEGFYPLRLSYPRLSHANLCTRAVLSAIQPEVAMEGLFILLARTLKRLAYDSLPAQAITCAFLLHFANLQGIKPRLNHCVRCQRRLGEEPAFLLPLEGGLCCQACGNKEPLRRLIPASSLDWLRQVLAQGIDKTPHLPEMLPTGQLISYINTHLDGKLPELQDE